MTNCSVYIGDLDDPNFDIKSQGPFGNIPSSLSKGFPPSREHYNGLFHSWVGEKDIQCVQTDDTGYVATVTKAQIVDYLAYAYGSDKSYTDPAHMLRWESKAYLVDKLVELKAFVDSLDGARLYALVAETD